MGTTKLSGVRLAGLASAVPSRVVSAVEASRQAEGITKEEALKVAAATGVQQRHVGPASICTSDLCCAAADRLLSELAWERDSVDALIFVSQTPDYDLPATSCCLQTRLGLSKHCAAFDVNLGCSGYVYGLWMAAHLLAAGSTKRLFLLAGETASRNLSPHDRSTFFLFGDAGTATALEKDGTAGPMTFVFGTDGAGKDHLIVPGGGMRSPLTHASLKRSVRRDGVLRSDQELYMNGAELFTFTLREVPPLVRSSLAASGWTVDNVDAFVFHQANLFILRQLAKRLQITDAQLPLSLEEFGNTSSASIPLTLTHRFSSRLQEEALRLVLVGFGVGYSWACLTLSCGPMLMPGLILLDEPAAHRSAEAGS